MTLCAHCHTPLSRWHNRPLCWPCLTATMAYLHSGYERGYGPVVRPAVAPPVNRRDHDEEWFDVRGREEDATHG